MNLQSQVIRLPYGKDWLELTDEGFTVLKSRINALCSGDGDKLVLDAMQKPYGDVSLCSMAAGANNAVIIISDHTRPVPSKYILPHMLSEMRKGNPAIDITLLVATGCHRGSTIEELRTKLGDNILHHERIVIHDCDRSEMVKVGTLPSGAPLVLNRLAVDTDLLVSEGFIEPHLFAGFSGGRKSVLPGICDRTTVLGNHCGAFIHSPNARTGLLDDNPIQADMEAAVKMANLRYIVNVIINDSHEVAEAYAGDSIEAHRAGCAELAEICRVQAEPACICITTNGGAPMDQNIYQAVKGMTAAEVTTRQGGIIILCAECSDGSGSDIFHHFMRDSHSIQEDYERLSNIPMEKTFPDQWQIQILMRILMKHTVIFVTRPELAQTIREMKMEYAETVEAALQMACLRVGGKAKTVVIPNGIGVIVSQ